MRKEAQQPEAWEWLKPEEHWEGEIREQASRRFFQIWNSLRGGGERQRTDSFIRPNTPLRCSIWRASVRKFDEILADLILRDKEGLMDSFIQGLEAIYPEVQAQAASNPTLKGALLDVDALLGKGRYEHEGLKPELLRQKEQQEAAEQTKLEEDPKARKKSPAESVVRTFYAGLQSFPALQKKYLEAVTDIKFVDVEGKLGKGVAGYHTGSSYAGGRQRPNKLLTFFMMKDPFPYLVSRPTKLPDDILKEFPNGNPPESPLEGAPAPGGKKTFEALQEYTMAGGAKIYVQNQKNPDYDFITIDPHQAGAKQTEVRRMLQQKAVELQKQSMFENVYLGKNVFQNSPAFADKKNMPGISLLVLGREGDYDIDDNERDLTQLDNGGLFWVPEKGLPKAETPTQPPGSVKYVWKGAALPPPKDLFAQSMEVIAQAIGMDAIWIDDNGNEYNSMEEILDEYEREEMEEGLPRAKEMIRQILDAELSRGARAPVPVPETEEPVEEEAEVYQMPEYQEQEQEEPELSLAAKQVIRLVRIANQLDNRGFSKEADLIDSIVRDIIERSTRS